MILIVHLKYFLILLPFPNLIDSLFLKNKNPKSIFDHLQGFVMCPIVNAYEILANMEP